MITWSEMSDAEQGALLLAHHRGEVIEYEYPKDPSGWEVCKHELWEYDFAYRVKKEPVVEVRREAVTIGRGVAQFVAYDTCTYVAYATCTYTDGKLTKIHWEAE